MAQVAQTDDAAREKQDFILSRGIKFPNDPSIIRAGVRDILRSGKYERREAEAVIKLARPDDTVLELGAGIGLISTLAAGRAKCVHTFEANRHLIPYIKRVHAANDARNVNVHNAILGKRKGIATFYVRRHFQASSLDRLEGRGVIAEEKVEVRNVRSVMKDLAPTLLICDIEGAEAALIPAMDLTGLRAVLVELHPQWIGKDGVGAVFAAMTKAGLIYYPGRSTAKVVCFRRDW